MVIYKGCAVLFVVLCAVARAALAVTDGEI
jgi:hypothetical protein